MSLIAKLIARCRELDRLYLAHDALFPPISAAPTEAQRRSLRRKQRRLWRAYTALRDQPMPQR